MKRVAPLCGLTADPQEGNGMSETSTLDYARASFNGLSRPQIVKERPFCVWWEVLGLET